MTPLLIAALLTAAPSGTPAPVTPVRPNKAVGGSPFEVGGSAEGSVNPPTDLPEVSVPFACGMTFPVSQAHDTGSHQYYDTYAWDFRMPEGTPVVAARDGMVRMARGDSTQGGCDAKMAPYANYVVLEHGNGLETQYLHFSKVVVAPGQPVKAGQLLGYSGNTGWSCGPHLHFKVATRRGNGWNNPSMPARILGYGDPERGTLVTAPACQPGLKGPIYAQQEAPSAEAAARRAEALAQGLPAQGANTAAPVPAVAHPTTSEVAPATGVGASPPDESRGLGAKAAPQLPAILSAPR